MPPSACSKHPARRAVAPENAPPLVPEHLALDQRLGHRRAVDRDERALAARPVEVQRPGDEFLARPALARHQHADVAVDDPPHELAQLAHPRTRPDDPAEGVGRLELGAQAVDLGPHPLDLELARHVPVDEQIANPLAAAVGHRLRELVEQRRPPRPGTARVRLDHARARGRTDRRNPIRHPDLRRALPEPPGRGAQRQLPQLVGGQVEQRLVPAVGEDQPFGPVIHRDGVAGGIEHGLEAPVRVRQLPAALGEVLLQVPLLHQRQADLLHLLAGEGLADVQQLVQQVDVADDRRQRLVRVRGHDDDLEVAVDSPHAAHRLDAVDARRHAYVDEGDGDGLASLVRLLDRGVAFLAVPRVPQIERREPDPGRAGRRIHEGRHQVVGRRRRAPRQQHLPEVVVDLLLIVHDQNAQVHEELRESGG